MDINQQSQGLDDRVIAFLDIGTNSIRLLLVRVYQNYSYQILNQEKEIIRLGEGEFVSQHLQAAAIERAVLVCKKFVDMANAFDAKEIYAFATSATREAKNKKDFLLKLKQEVHLDVRIVSGLEEARLIYLGASGGLHLDHKQALFIDIGGGSTEIIVGNQNQFQFLDSLKIGAIRLTSLFFLPEETGPVPDARYALIQRYIRNATIRTLQHIRQYRIDLLVGTSGTIENLGEIASQMFFHRSRTQDDLLTFDQLEQVIHTLCSSSLEDRQKIPGITPSRADIIIAGAAIIHTIMQDLGVKEIRICERGFRDGLLIDYLLKNEHALVEEEMSIRERSVLQLGRACGFEELHHKQVANLALQLYDSAKEINLHTYGNNKRELFSYAALLHDIGTFLSQSNHHVHTYYIIKNADLLGFDQKEINIIATLAYFHRKKRPKPKHKPFADLEPNEQKIVQKLAVLLQLAESLDRSHASVIKKVSFKKENKNEIILEIEADKDCQLEIWGSNNQKRAFKKTYGKKLNVKTKLIPQIE